MDSISQIIDNLPEENKRFILDLIALVFQLQYGSFTPIIKVHQGKVVSAEFRGWKKIKYNKNNQEQMLVDLGKRIKQAKESKKRTKLVFMINFVNGLATELLWDSYFQKEY